MNLLMRKDPFSRFQEALSAIEVQAGEKFSETIFIPEKLRYLRRTKILLSSGTSSHQALCFQKSHSGRYILNPEDTKDMQH